MRGRLPAPMRRSDSDDAGNGVTMGAPEQGDELESCPEDQPRGDQGRRVHDAGDVAKVVGQTCHRQEDRYCEQIATDSGRVIRNMCHELLFLR